MVEILKMAVTFALVLGVLVVIHELGHFLVAKFFGIRVEVFSVGFGKRIWGTKKGDTDYRLSLIPLGGYVKMAGENLDEQITGAPDEFMSKPKWQRFCVAVAGPVMNIIMAIAIPAALVMIHYEVPASLNKPAVVSAVEPSSPAEKAGLKPGDLITEIAGEPIPTWRDVTEQVIVRPDQEVPVTIKRSGETQQLMVRIASDPTEQEKIGYLGASPDPGPNTKIVVETIEAGSPAAEAGLKPGDQLLAVNGTPVPQNRQGTYTIIRTIKGSASQPVTLTVKRGDESLDIKATPRNVDGVERLGFGQNLHGADMIVTRLSPADAFNYSLDYNMRILRLTKTALAQVFVGQRSAKDTLTGPVGIFKLSGQAAEQGMQSVLQLMALLSLNLGIFNLLPIPVLDGGMIFLLVLEGLLGLFGLTLGLRVKEKMMQVGFVMLMLLMGFVIFNDISKLFPSRATPPQQVEQQAPPENK
ncbi:MAG TPA: RIP metalloprotease RseP [Blastocatellia bacterium]|nr:RIP metalloprotease RseP [Blastocatellia bacterium]